VSGSELNIAIVYEHKSYSVSYRLGIPHFFFGDGFACERALPATDFDLSLVRQSRKTDDALLATAGDVCLGLFFALAI
jgi:hypothetical protein